jgi:hypothetical protein
VILCCVFSASLFLRPYRATATYSCFQRAVARLLPTFSPFRAVVTRLPLQQAAARCYQHSAPSGIRVNLRNSYTFFQNGLGDLFGDHSSSGMQEEEVLWNCTLSLGEEIVR